MYTGDAQRPSGAEQIVVGVDHVDLGIGVEYSCDGGERFGLEHVVVVDEHDVLPGRRGQRVVGGGDDPAVARRRTT